MASRAGLYERALAHFEVAVTAYRVGGLVIDAARLTAQFAHPLRRLGRAEHAIVLLREAIASLDPDSAPPSVVAELQEGLGGSLIFAGRPQDAAEPIEQALTLAQRYELANTLARALGSRALFLHFVGRHEEARLGYEGTLELTRRLGLTQEEMSAESNLADLCMTRDLPGAEEHCRALLVVARRWGARGNEILATENLIYVLTMAGRFEEALRLGTDALQAGADESSEASWLHCQMALLEALRGQATRAREHLARGDDMADTRRRSSSGDVRDG